MKRGLVFTLCAFALVAGSSLAQAQNVQLSLNLRYTDPNTPASGGVWYLVAKTDDADGIAAINAYISNISTTMSYGAAGTHGFPTVTAANLGAILNAGQPFKADLGGGTINVVYGQDTATGPIVPDVGQGAGPPATPGNVAVDQFKNATWNNSAIIANGSFTGTRPAFVAAGANSTDANTLAGATLGVAAQDAVTTTVVRGDSVATDGLKPGDANRDNIVNLLDFSILSASFGQATTTWDQGNFNSATGTNLLDFSILSANYNMSRTPPAAAAAGAVPEPTGAVLLGIALLGLASRAKRR